MIKVGVIFGGESVEHEISIITAIQAMGFMNENKYQVVPIYISKDRVWYTGYVLKDIEIYKDMNDIKRFATEVCLTKKGNRFVLQKTKGLFNREVEDIDIAFPIVHGKGVEDGTLAGLLESIGIPFVGPKVLGASIGQDKVVQKQVMQASNVPVVDYTWFYDFEYELNSEDILKSIKKVGYPVIVKPANLGSSVGISIAKDEKTVKDCIEEAIKYDKKIIVEKVVDNLLEVDIAVLGNKEEMELSLIGEMNFSNEFFTFEDKYLGPGGKKTGGKTSSKTGSQISGLGFRIPAKIDKDIEKKIEDAALKAYRCLNLEGVTRFDFLVNKKTKEVFVNEPNTIPGCLAFFFYTPKGKDYTTLLDELITLAIKSYKKNSSKITSFESNVLSTYNGSKGGKGKMKIQN